MCLCGSRQHLRLPSQSTVVTGWPKRQLLHPQVTKHQFLLLSSCSVWLQEQSEGLSIVCLNITCCFHLGSLRGPEAVALHVAHGVDAPAVVRRGEWVDEHGMPGKLMLLFSKVCHNYKVPLGNFPGVFSLKNINV